MGRLIKVKTVFSGQVGFPEKFYRKDATVVVGDKYMDLLGLTPTHFSEWMDDKFGRGKYRLIYFKWIPRDRLTKKKKAQQEASAKWINMSEEERYKFTH